jgi:hypothetical protein
MFLQNTWTNILRGVETQNITEVEEPAERDINVQAYWYRLHDIFLFMQGNFICKTGGKQEGMLLIIDTLPPPFTRGVGGEGTHKHT